MPRGGTYRVGWERFIDWGDGLDPVGEFNSMEWGIYSNLLVRTLVGYEHVAGEAGRKLVPDLATRVPTPTNGGKTYSFTLRRGVRFGPPVNREVTSKDIRYAIERHARPGTAQFRFYFNVIAGFDAHRRGRARSVAGIVTPNARTIVFNLTRPTGDFLHRLTLPAAGPIPAEVGRCVEGKPDRYYLTPISSGPYMVEGSAALRFRPCSALEPVPSLSDDRLALVRNPNFDPRTGTATSRENNPDRFEFVAVEYPVVSIVKKLNAGALDDAILYTTPTVLSRHMRSAARRGRLRVNPADWVFSLSMNLTKPPFDDVHVRRAMSWVMDKAALREAFGGPQAGSIAHHLVPDDLLGGRLTDFAPFGTPGDHGDLAKARAEMAKSKYATRRGVCVDMACRGVFLGSEHSDHAGFGMRTKPVIKALGAKLGIRFRVGGRGGGARTPTSTNAISAGGWWYADYPDAANFIDPLFHSAAILPQRSPNASLVGITRAQAARLGVKGRVKGVPSVDADIGRCSRLSGEPRLDCYAQLDRRLSTQVVAVIPFLRRNRITLLGPQAGRWAFDRSTGMTAFAHVAVKR